MRLFVAAWPPDEVRDEIVEWAADQLSPEGVRWLPADRLHVTLAFAGEVDEPAGVEAAVRAVAAGASPLEASLGVVTMRFGGVLAVPVDGLDDLGQALTDAVADAIGSDERRGFRGHLTLARVGRRQRVPATLAGLPLLGGTRPSWTVDHLDVVRSHLGADARYETLASVPLGG